MIPVAKIDLGDGMIFYWKVDETGERLYSKDCRHVLQANGGLITSCYSNKALIFHKSTSYGNHLERICKSDDLRDDSMLMVGLALELAEFMERTCPDLQMVLTLPWPSLPKWVSVACTLWRTCQWKKSRQPCVM